MSENVGEPVQTPRVQLALVFLAVFLGTAGGAVLIPATPKLVDAAGSPLLFGMTQSAVNLCSVLGSAALGWYSDLHGRRAAWFAFVTLVVMGSTILLLGGVGFSRIGLIMRMNPGVIMTLGSATVTDLTAHDQVTQARVISRLGAAFSAGFSLGAPLGGRLSRHGSTSNVAVALFAAVLQLFVIFFFPRAVCVVDANEATNQETKVTMTSGEISAPCADKSEASSDTNAVCKSSTLAKESPLRFLLLLWRDGAMSVRALLFARFCSGLCRQLVLATFQLFTQQRFGTTPEMFGYFLSAVGFSFMFVNVLIVPPLFRLPGLSQLHFFIAGFVVLSVARFGISVAPSLPLVVVGDCLVAVGSGLVASSGTTLLSDLVPASQRGLVLGAAGSVEITGGVFGPALSGWCFARIGSFAPAAVAALICAMAAFVVACAANKELSAGTMKDKKVL